MQATIKDIGYMFSSYKGSAKHKQRSFNLTKEQFLQLVMGNCFYCNKAPEDNSTVALCSTKEVHGWSRYGIHHNGIDRVDNTIGYTLENCVPCCTLCNRMKYTLSAKTFIEHIRRINNHWQDRELSNG